MRLGYIGLVMLLAFLIGCHQEKSITEPDVSSSAGSNEILAKYAEKLKVSQSELSNVMLYNFVDDWYGTTYKYGGMSKSGVDCSGFCNLVYTNVYKKEIPRRTSDIANVIQVVSKNDLQEGDVVFFNISGKSNSHVGVYLVNNYFVHASTSKGVIISHLDNPYYKKSYSKGGKL